ncbi:hypothetical protein [Ramlibacter montanisoli]|uniref:hypothetical protein n=1 Tax=Ramlibacter montanisoli TaxID=2732512 RepID=UPI001C0F2D07|nr:hypothetical protein [Ramlibacter montanisoli]
MNTSTPQRAPGAQRRSLLFTFALLAGGLLSACSADARMQPPQSPADYATERDSAQGTFRVSYRTEAGVPVGRMHAWTLRVQRPDGTPSPTPPSRWTATCRSTCMACRRGRA